MTRFLAKLHFLLTIPASIVLILHSAKIHPAYRMTWLRKLRLGLTMFLNTRRIPTGTTYRTHLAIALKLLETPPEVPGVVVECGSWKGGSSANLSLVCRIVGRKLEVCDSFRGLPPSAPGDREARFYQAGDYVGTLDEVRTAIRRYGAIECCEFVEGWFEETLPKQEGPVLVAFVDVDLGASLHTCVRHLWPRLVPEGYLFVDESVGTDYCALFYSETWWRRYFNATPPGLIGAGTGLPLGDFYIGPWSERNDHPGQRASSGAYTGKSLSGHWTYYPEE
jgi:hypothetical protein